MFTPWEDYCHHVVYQNMDGAAQLFPRLPKVLTELEPNNRYLGYKVDSINQILFYHTLVVRDYWNHLQNGWIGEDFDARSFGVESIKFYFQNHSPPVSGSVPSNASFHSFNAGQPETYQYSNYNQVPHWNSQVQTDYQDAPNGNLNSNYNQVPVPSNASFHSSNAGQPETYQYSNYNQVPQWSSQVQTDYQDAPNGNLYSNYNQVPQWSGQVQPVYQDSPSGNQYWNYNQVPQWSGPVQQNFQSGSMYSSYNQVPQWSNQVQTVYQDSPSGNQYSSYDQAQQWGNQVQMVPLAAPSGNLQTVALNQFWPYQIKLEWPNENSFRWQPPPQVDPIKINSEQLSNSATTSETDYSPAAKETCRDERAHSPAQKNTSEHKTEPKELLKILGEKLEVQVGSGTTRVIGELGGDSKATLTAATFSEIVSGAVDKKPLPLSTVVQNKTSKSAASLQTKVLPALKLRSAPVKIQNVAEEPSPTVKNDWITVRNKKQIYEKSVKVPITATITLENGMENSKSSLPTLGRSSTPPDSSESKTLEFIKPVKTESVAKPTKKQIYEKRVEVPITATIKLENGMENSKSSLPTLERSSTPPDSSESKTLEFIKPVKIKSVAKSTLKKKQLSKNTDEFEVHYDDKELFFTEGKKFAHVLRSPEKSERGHFEASKRFAIAANSHSDDQEPGSFFRLLLSLSMVEQSIVKSRKKEYWNVQKGQPTGGAVTEQAKKMMVTAIKRVKTSKQCQWHLMPVNWMMKTQSGKTKTEIEFCQFCILQKRCVPALQYCSKNMITMIGETEERFAKETCDIISIEWFNAELAKLNEADPSKAQPSPMTKEEFMMMEPFILSLKHFNKDKCSLHHEQCCMLLKLSAFDKPFTEHKICKKCTVDAVIGDRLGIPLKIWFAVAHLQRVSGFEFVFDVEDKLGFYSQKDYNLLNDCFRPPMAKWKENDEQSKSKSFETAA